MKKYFKISAFALFALTPALAHAERCLPPPVLKAELTRVVRYQDSLEMDGFMGGSVSIDPARGEAELFVERRFYCPPRQLCLQVMPAPLEVKLPLVKVSKNHCGATVYLAQEDKRPVDGNLKILEIIDNSTNICQTYIALAPTEIRYVNVTAGMDGAPGETTYRFEADKLSSY